MKIQPPNVVLGEELPHEITEAAQMLVAQAVHKEADVLNIVLNYATDRNEQIGSFEISVRRLDC